MAALPPATLEGWYALHQVFATDWAALRALPAAERVAVTRAAQFWTRAEAAPGQGWSACFQLVGGGADWLFIHFRPSLEELADVQLRQRASPLGPLLQQRYHFLSITEAGLYHATAEAARETEPGSAEFERLLQERARQELASAHVQTRLYPRVPEGMRYVSFYPMSKRRGETFNWYALPVEERSRLMRDHGLTGRRFAGRIFQVITGSVGLADWEWGVTLFASDPLEFKRIVTEMRYDEASSRYGEFGQFFTGIRIEQDQWPALLGAEAA